MRRVMETDSDSSVPEATADSMRRRSGRLSAQKAASACSLSNSGTSSQLAIVFMHANLQACRAPDTWSGMASSAAATATVTGSGIPQGLVHLAFVKVSLFGLERPGVNHSDGLA